MEPRSRIQGLDVLRGGAVSLVLLKHAWPDFFDGAGIVGVTLFFALSGYLITGLLLRDLEREGRIRIGRFYAHRFFRLYPALIGLEVGYGVLCLLLHGYTLHELGRSSVIGLLYLTDVPTPWSIPYRGMEHLWTLAVEEQFYLLWPFVLLLGWRLRRVGLALAASAVAILFASLALPLATSVTVHQVYQAPTTWAITLLMGAAARVYRGRLQALIRYGWLAWASCAFLVAASFTPDADRHISRMLALGPLVGAAGIILVVAMEQKPTVVGMLRPLYALGTISYAAYLWNYPISVMMTPPGGADMPILGGLASIALTIVTAILSWLTVERVGRWLRARYDHHHTVDDPRPAAVLVAH